MSIQYKKAVEPVLVVSSGANKVFWLIAIAMTISVIGILFLPFLFLYGYQIYAIGQANKLSPEIIANAKKAFEALIGHMPKYIDVSVSPSSQSGMLTATGVAYEGHVLYLMEDGVLATIPFEDIRDWRWEIPGYETIKIIRGTQADRQIAGIENREARAKAALKSGMFINVKDVGRPEWHFMCDDAKLLKRWHEILTQASEQPERPVDQEINRVHATANEASERGQPVVQESTAAQSLPDMKGKPNKRSFGPAAIAGVVLLGVIGVAWGVFFGGGNPEKQKVSQPVSQRAMSNSQIATSSTLDRPAQNPSNYSSAKTLVGNWHGAYICGQGRTNVDFTVDENLNARFRFFSLENSGIGTFDGFILGAVALSNNGTQVIYRPHGKNIDGWRITPSDKGVGWTSIGFTATLAPENLTLIGQVHDKYGACSTIDLRKS